MLRVSRGHLGGHTVQIDGNRVEVVLRQPPAGHDARETLKVGDAHHRSREIAARLRPVAAIDRVTRRAVRPEYRLAAARVGRAPATGDEGQP
jgi:hypothetical protein